MFRYINNVIKRIIHRWLFTYHYDLVLLDASRAPIRAYKRDAGYDLFVSRSVKIPKGKIINVSTGVAIKANGVPAWILLTSRSSTMLRHGLVVNNGIIDCDYAGELSITVLNPTNEDVYLHPDMRIGQMIIIPHTNCIFTHKDKLKIRKNERGYKGFGSTGQ